MKENHLKRLLILRPGDQAMVVSLCPTIAFAGDTLPYHGREHFGRQRAHISRLPGRGPAVLRSGDGPDAGASAGAGASAEPH